MSQPGPAPLAGRTILVTGAGSGIGRACARLLDAQGASLQHVLPHLARQITQHQLAADGGVRGCTGLPEHPATAAAVPRLEEQEQLLDVPQLVAECLANTRELDLETLDQRPVAGLGND